MLKLITLTTDFGLDDWFVGAMKGVIAGIARDARVIDLTHSVPPGDVRAGSFALAAACRYFPKGTVHVAVVDPGVGSARKAIAIETANYFFVGPDNGLLSWALRQEKMRVIRSVANSDYFLQPLSRTFHGRDLFAPVAAHLSLGLPIQKLGPALNDLMRLPWPQPRRTNKGIQGEVLYLDHFGNAITNLDESSLRGPGPGTFSVFIGRRRLCDVAPFYQAVSPGKTVAVFGSSGLLEVAVNGGSAGRTLGLSAGSRICVQPV